LKRFLIGGMVLLLVLPLAAGCGRNERIAARVNGETITEDEFLARVQTVNAVQLGTSAQARGPARAGEMALDRLIQERLLLQLGAEKKVVPTPEQVNAYVALAKKFQNRQEFPVLTFMQPDPFRTEEDWQRDAKMALIFRGLVKAPMNLKEEEVRKLYDRIKTLLAERDQYHLRLIDIVNKAKAQKALESLLKGVPFETVALKESDDPVSGRNSGDIGWQPDVQIPQPILQAVKNLKAGDFTKQLIKAPSAASAPGAPPQDHYFLAQLVEKRPGRTPTFEEIRLFCENLYMQQTEPMAFQPNGRVQLALREFREKASIQINLKPYENMLKKPTTPSSEPPPGGPPPGVAAPGTPSGG